MRKRYKGTTHFYTLDFLHANFEPKITKVQIGQKKMLTNLLGWLNNYSEIFQNIHMVNSSATIMPKIKSKYIKNNRAMKPFINRKSSQLVIRLLIQMN